MFKFHKVAKATFLILGGILIMADPLAQAKSMAKYNNSLALSNAKQAQAFNAVEAAKNRDWQERLSNSAHQREVADLKKAGLNPVLSALSGQGAATPSGSSASGEAAPIDMSLTKGIIDMANAQLNSATTLQTAALNSNAAMARLIYDSEQQYRRHTTPSGDSKIGQIAAIPNLVNSLWSDFGKTSAGNRFNNSIDKYISRQKKVTDIDKLISGLRQGKEGAELSAYAYVPNKSYRHPSRGSRSSRLSRFARSNKK